MHLGSLGKRLGGVKRKNAAEILLCRQGIGAVFDLRRVFSENLIILSSFGGLGLEVPGGKPLVLGFAEAAFAQVFFEVGHVGGAVEDGDIAFLGLAELLVEDVEGDLVAWGEDDRAFAVGAAVDAGEHEFDLVQLAGKEPFEGMSAVVAGEGAKNLSKRGRARLARELHAPFLEGRLEHECEEVFFSLILKAGKDGGIHVRVDEVGGRVVDFFHLGLKFEDGLHGLLHLSGQHLADKAGVFGGLAGAALFAVFRRTKAAFGGQRTRFFDFNHFVKNGVVVAESLV